MRSKIVFIPFLCFAFLLFNLPQDLPAGARQSRKSASVNKSNNNISKSHNSNANRSSSANRNANTNANRNTNVNNNVNVNRNVNVNSNNNAYVNRNYHGSGTVYHGEETAVARGPRGAVVKGEEGYAAVGRGGAVVTGEEGFAGAGRYGVVSGEYYDDYEGWKAVAAVGTAIAVGTMLAKPPVAAVPVTVASTPYYYSDGSYYSKVYQSGEVVYQVVPAPAGAVITTLPPGCSVTNVGGVTYQQCGTTHYQQVSNGYQVVVLN